MNNKIIIPALLVPVVGCSPKEENPKLPNILCITCEDISPMLGCYGDAVAVTPNLDEFSHSAIRYNMYSSVGVSAPSRYSLITGRYPSADGANYMRTGSKEARPEGIPEYSAIPEAGVKCFSEYLREAGYYCTNNDKTDYQFTPVETAWDDCSKGAHWKNRKEGQPFFAVFNLFVTHESQTWARTNKPLSVDPADIIVPDYYPDTDTVRHDMAVAYSNVTEMDRQFQRLYKELQDAGELENTIVIWYSDNGGPLPRQKREIYESGALVPFMISFPDGYRKGEHSTELVAFVDIPATILSLAGIEPKENMHGTPFLGKYKGESREYVYGAKDRMDECIDKQGCVRDAKFRYLRNYYPGEVGYRHVSYRAAMPMMQQMLDMEKHGKLNAAQSRWFSEPRAEEEFYDVTTDPYEMRNLINDPYYKEDIERLRAEYDRWDKEYNQYWALEEIDNLNRIHPNGVTPKVATPTATLSGNTLSAKCETEGSSIAYTTFKDELPETPHWLLYTSEVEVPEGEKVMVRACRIGYDDSEIISL